MVAHPAPHRSRSDVPAARPVAVGTLPIRHRHSPEPGLRPAVAMLRTVLHLRLPVSYTHLRAHETPEHLVCRLLLEKKKKNKKKKKKKFFFFFFNDTATTEIYT